MTRRIQPLVAVVLGVFVLAGCGGSGSDAGADGVDDLRIAGIFSGPTTDADYNALGLQALEALEEEGAEIAYSESVAVPDIERVLQEYVADGYDVIWTHGSQFYDATAKIAGENPDVNFVGEFDGVPEGQPENVWVIDRNFHTTFYPLGTLAAHLTKTGQVGYLGGLSLPFSYSEVHAVEQAIEASGKEVAVNPVWSGDFNDTVKAQQLTTQLLNNGNDIIVSSLNLGVVGAFDAIKDTPAGESWITVKYTDKSRFAPEHYAASVLYDFVAPMQAIIGDIGNGETQGRYVIGFNEGATVDIGENVPEEARAATEEVISQIADGSIEVELDQSPIE